MRRGRIGKGRLRPRRTALQPRAALELLEGELQRAEAVRLERVADDLVLAFCGVHADAAARHHALAVSGANLSSRAAVRNITGEAAPRRLSA